MSERDNSRWIAETRKLKLLSQKVLETSESQDKLRYRTLWPPNLNCLSCAVGCTLERAERNIRSQTEESAGYLCSKWLSLI